MKRRKAALWAMAVTTALCLSGCGGSTGTAAGTSSEGTSSSEGMSSSEGTSSSEGMAASGGAASSEEAVHDTAILVVSFGTSFNDSRDITIGAVEQAIADAFSQYEVRRAFTAQIIIDKLNERDGLEIDNVTQALDRAVADGVKNLIVQPTYLMSGFEYQDMMQELEEYQEDFDQIVVGEPLLASDEDFLAVANALTEATAQEDDGETAIVLMGHGTEAESNQVYEKMQKTLSEAGRTNYYIGTVEAEPTLEDVSAALREAGMYKKVVLRPLMLVAGDHANHDMAGDEEDSWKTVLEAEGYETVCQIHGLGELEAIQKIYVEHTKKAVDALK